MYRCRSWSLKLERCSEWFGCFPCLLPQSYRELSEMLRHGIFSGHKGASLHLQPDGNS